MHVTSFTPTCHRFMRRVHDHAHDVYITAAPVLWVHEAVMGVCLIAGLLIVMFVQAYVDEAKGTIN